MSDSDLWARITTLQMKLAAAEKQSAARREAMAEQTRTIDALTHGARQAEDALRKQIEQLKDERGELATRLAGYGATLEQTRIHAEAVERERDEALRRADIAEAVAKTSDLPCGHSDQYAYSADGGKHVLCLVCVLHERDAARKLVIRDGADQVVTQGAFNALVGQRNDLQAKLDDIEGAYRIVIDEKCASDEKHCTCVPHLRRRIDELKYETEWIRRKLKLAPETTTGDLQGKMHVICHRADGYMAYIVAYKCNDKQGEIARLSVRIAELEHALHAEEAEIVRRMLQLEEQAKKDKAQIDELALHRNKLNKALNAACASGTAHRERADALEAELREWKRGEHTHSQTHSGKGG